MIARREGRGRVRGYVGRQEGKCWDAIALEVSCKKKSATYW